MCLWKAQFEEAGRANDVTSQLTQQTEYCAGMGAACATLLWRVSRQDDAVESLLTGVSHVVVGVVVVVVVVAVVVVAVVVVVVVVVVVMFVVVVVVVAAAKESAYY